jgi:hypothetical protein
VPRGDLPRVVTLHEAVMVASRVAAKVAMVDKSRAAVSNIRRLCGASLEACDLFLILETKFGAAANGEPQHGVASDRYTWYTS